MKLCSRNHQYESILKQCPYCQKAAAKRHKEANKDAIKQYNQQWRQINKSKETIKIKSWKVKNSESERLNQKKWREANPSYQAEWRSKNPGKRNAIEAKYRASKLRATPSWLTVDQLKEIDEIYQLAQDLAWLNQDGKPFDVDHIVPLQGKNVSGFHVPWNLQLLPHTINCEKGNKYGYSERTN